MTKREIAALACKVLGVYAVLHGIPYLAALFYSWSWGALLSGFIPFVLFVVLGLILWWQADRLATYMVSGMETQVSETKVIQTDIEPIAFSAVGLFILAGAVAGAVGLLVRMLYEVRTGWQSFAISSGQTYQDAAMIAARLVIGLWLLLGSRGFARFLDRVRDLGKVDVDDSVDESQD